MLLQPDYLIHNAQPICGFIAGISLLMLTLFLNYGRTKIQAKAWLKRTFYNKNDRSDYLALKLIDGISKFSLLFGLGLVLLSIYYLQNIT
jgi:hypothetical protein